VRAAALRKTALSLANAISNGLRSGVGQEQKPGAPLGDGLCGPRALMDVEVVEDDHVAGLESRRQLRAHIDVESLAVYGAFNDPRSDEFVAPE